MASHADHTEEKVGLQWTCFEYLDLLDASERIEKPWTDGQYCRTELQTDRKSWTLSKGQTQDFDGRKKTEKEHFDRWLLTIKRKI